MKCNVRLALLVTIFLAGSLSAVAQTPQKDPLSKPGSADTAAKNKTSAQSLKTTDEQTVFQAVEIEASVDINQWRQHLQGHLMAPIAKAARKGMRVGTYTVNVRFLVEKDGSISDVKALDDPGYGLAAASEKVVKTGPRWSPGIYEGKIVRSYHTQPITFVISEK